MNKTTRSLIVTGIGLFFLTSVGMVAASPSTTKSSPLYPLKMAIEAITLASASQEDKAVKQIEQIDERLVELEILKNKINDLEKNQKLEQAAKLQAAAETTKIETKKVVLEAKNNAEFISDQSKKDDVLEKLEATVNRLDDDENEDEIEEAEPEEEPEAEEEKEENEGRENDED